MKPRRNTDCELISEVSGSTAEMLATSPKALGKLSSLARPKTFKVLIIGHSGVGKTGEFSGGKLMKKMVLFE